MKKLFLLAVAAVLSVAASADDLYVGGQVGFWHEGDDSRSTNSLTILPEVGYNINSKWAAGATFGYSGNHICGVASTHIFQFNPYSRYTFFTSSNNFVSLFVDGSVGFGAGWTSYKGHKASDTACIWEIGLKPGIALNLSSRVSLVAHLGMLGYQGANNAAKAGGAVDQGGLLLNGNNVSLGFYVNF